MVAMAAFALCACKSSAPEASEEKGPCPLCIVENVPTIQSFTKESIPEEDLQRIANAGLNAPSAMNMQPWHFTVVNGEEAVGALAAAQKDAMKNMKFPPMPPKGMPEPPKGGPGPDGPKAGPGGDRPAPPTGRGPRSELGDTPVVILISCRPGSEFDAGLACESMNDMANLLGYGTKIVSSITMMFRGDNKDELYAKYQVPEGQEIVAAILLGKINTEGYDAVTSATPRNDFDKVVSFVK